VAALTAIHQLGVGSGIVLLATATAADLSTWFQGPVATLRRARSGLLLCPAPGDADVLGIRLPRTPVPVRPGSGWLVSAGVPERVQVARHRQRPATAQSSSSTGPISCVAYQASS
jgi:DNA segregation ATPase FtsK/SpoIIIE, S-DNA-T family